MCRLSRMYFGIDNTNMLLITHLIGQSVLQRDFGFANIMSRKLGGFHI
jgi:hypothetical protein